MGGEDSTRIVRYLYAVGVVGLMGRRYFVERSARWGRELYPSEKGGDSPEFGEAVSVYQEPGGRAGRLQLVLEERREERELL